MAKTGNRRRTAPKPKKTFFKTKNFLVPVTNWVNEKLSIEEHISVDTVKKILWFTGLVLLYIFFQLNYENKIRELDKIRAKMNESRAAYITRKSSYLYESKQSEVENKLKAQGLTKNIEAPIKIQIDN